MDKSQLIGDRYELGELLGKGGMGAVYRATDHLTGHTVALKRVTIDTQQLQFATLGQETNESRLALATEFHTLAGLRHPFIVGVIDYGFDSDGQPYFTMQIVENSRPITEYARDNDRATQVQMVIDMLQALVYLHRRGIVHRDLKPANVLVNQQGLVQVMDFGLAVNQSQTSTSGIAGTLGYMAPEILQEQPATAQSDIFAAGVIIYEILTGKHPFDTSSTTRLLYSILNERPDLSDLEPETAHVIGRMLETDPVLRFSAVDQIIDSFCEIFDLPLPPETTAIRDSFLSASRFVGREDELSILREGLENARSGHGSAYLVGGESGVGKSRLLNELRTHALVEGALVLRGQAVDGGGSAYQLWRDVLPRLLLSVPVSATEAHILQAIVPDIQRFVSVTPAELPEIPGSMAQQRLALTIAELFERHTEPIVLLLEDLQWTKESLEPVKHILTSIHEQPLLVVGSYRSDEAANLPDQLPQAAVLSLQRLDSQHIESLSASMLGSAGTQPEVVDLLKKETEGNVYFLVEVVRALAEEAGRLTDVGRFTLPERVFAGGIRQVIRRRLNHIPDWGQNLLKLAAIAGRQIEPALIARLADQENITQWLTLCSEAAVLEVSDDHWRFCHDKLRETILHDLDDTEQPGLYTQVAEAIEATYPDTSDHAEQLVHLWQKAGNVQKEWHYAFQAAAQALRLGNYHLAVKHARRALALHPQAADKDYVLREADLHYILGEASENLGHMVEAHSAYETALAGFRQLNDAASVAKALAALGNLDTLQDNFDRAIQRIDESLVIRRQIHDDKGTALSLLNRGVVEVKMRNYTTAETMWLECRDILLNEDDPHELAKIYNNLGILYDLTGRTDEAYRHYEQAINIREQNDDRPGLALTIGNLGAMLAATEQYQQARDNLTRAMGLYRQLHLKRGLAFGLDQMAYIARVHDENHIYALSLLREALALNHELGALDDLCGNYRDIAANELALGNTVEARQALSEAVRVANQLNHARLQHQIAFGYAKVLLKEENVKEGLAILLYLQSEADDDLKIAEALTDYRAEYSLETYQQAETRSATMTLADITRAIENAVQG